MKIVRFFREAYRDNAVRRERRRDISVDLLLYAKNRFLQPWERWLTRGHSEGDAPLVFIVGVPRSGTTLLHSLMVQHLEVGYISNVVSRYWMAPLYATIRHHREEGPVSGPLLSDLGATFGKDSPHEFTYFWQFWAEFSGTDDASDEVLDRVDWQSIRRELTALSSWWQRPLLLKALTYVDYNVDRFAREFPRSCFIDVRREAAFVVQSILESRQQRYGDEAEWWSIRPSDVAEWRHRDPIDQVLHQVRDARQALDAQLSCLAADRWMRVDYERLVADPAGILSGLAGYLGVPIRSEDTLSTLALESTNTRRMSPQRWRRVADSLQM